MGSCRAILRSFVRPLRGEGGFTLVESMMAMVLLVMVGTSISGMLAASVKTYSGSRERTLAGQLALEQVEAIRRMSFSAVGLPNGNPSGSLTASKPVTVVGLGATITTQVSYIDDQTPNSYRTYANYKKVTVSVVRNSDSRVIAREVTYLSAAAKNAATESVIKATLLDLGDSTPVVGATVNLASGPSAPRTDATDASGTAIFPSLTANPTSGAQAYYDLNLVLPYGYQALSDDLPPSGAAHTQLGVADTWPTVLRVYKPCTINVNIPTPPKNGTPVATVLPYTLSVGSARGTQALAQGAGATFLPVTTIDGEPLVPLPSSASSSQYTAGASAVYGSGSTARYFFTTGVSLPVPTAYPSDLTKYFTLGAGTWYAATDVRALTIKVQNSSGTAIGGAQVNVSGGPGAAPGIYVTATTAASGTSKGQVTVNVPATTTGTSYTITAWGPSTSAQLTGQSVTGTITKTLTVS